MNKIITVSELNTILKTAMENDEYFKNIYVIGEISNLTLNKSGHIYFSIKDEGASINCMIWKDKANSLLKLNPKEGMKITCLGRITYYVPTGRVSLEVRDVKIEGKGELQEIFDKRKQELEKLGWFDKSIKKPIPRFPKNIGIVTAATGAAIHDLITTMTRRFPGINIFLFPSQVQGEQAQYDIANKIKQANMFQPKLDVLIVGRGGGSYEDLWSFNEMPVLKAIKESIVPTISAVGHEPDVTLSDYVADLRAATPTAAGEIATPNIVELKRELEYYYVQSKQNISRTYKQAKEYVNSANNLAVQIMSKIIINNQNELNYLLDKNKSNITNKFLNNEMILNHLIQTINLLDPNLPLKRGYSLIKDNDGNVITSINQVTEGAMVKIRMNDGTLLTKVETKEKNNGK